MEQVRIGMIGAGVIGSAHSLVLREIANALGARVRLVAVADPDPEARERVATGFDYRRAYATADELLSDPEVDTVFVCTPTCFHHGLVCSAAAAGKHIFCEKPLAMSYAEGAAMVAAVERAAVHAQIGLVLRFSSVYSVMRDLVSEPGSGRPLAVVFRDDQCFPIRGLHSSPWRADPTQTAGGTLIEHGVHDLDLLQWMFGPIARLRAWQHNFAGVPGIEDYVAAEIEHASGLRTQLVNIWHDMLQRPSNRRLEIICERAFIASDHDTSGPILVQRGDGEAEKLQPDEVLRRFLAQRGAAAHPLRDWFPVAYLVQDLAFVEALLADRPPDPSLRVGLEAQRLAEAVYHAAHNRCEVVLETYTPDTDKPIRI